MSILRRLTSWKESFGSGSVRRGAAKRRNRRPQQPRQRVGCFEWLEDRRLLVVGALAPVGPTPSDQFTGVVRLGGTALEATNATCSATLLETGRHLLTAGHCIVKNETQQIILVPQGAGPMFGSFQLIFGGQVTDAIPLFSSADTVEAELEELPNITNVSVSSGPSFGGYTVTFRGNWAVTDVPQMTAVSQLNGAFAVVATTNSGAAFIGDARFDLPSGSYVFSPTSQSDVVVHPNWSELYFGDDGADQGGFDIAIIRLPAIAPLGAERYEVYDDQDEVGQQFTIVGYGRTGVGATGENAGPPDTANVRRSGVNEYGDVFTNGHLRSDFDDGSEAQNSLDDGTGLGDDEAGVARGDSGGPNFLGNRISGINSAVDAAGLAGFSAFGDNNYYTRVSDFTQNRDPLFDIHDIIEAPDDIVLDMNLQDDGNDGEADAIDVQLIGPGNNRVQITLNGQEVWSDLKSRVLSLTIIGSADQDIVHVNGDLEVGVTVRGEAGNDALVGGPGNEVLYGGPGNDNLNGQEGNDILFGEEDNDLVIGDTGLDFMSGGPGSDQLFEQVAGNVLLASGSLTQNGIGEAIVSFESAILVGSLGDDVISAVGFFAPVTVFAGAGDDFVTGHTGSDELFGQDGDDTLEGGAGDDTLWGGNDDDTLRGGIEEDELHGEDGHDDLLGQAHDDTLFGEDGNDLLVGGGDADTLNGGEGHDQLIGGQLIDSLDDVDADNGADTLNGAEGNDAIIADDGSFLPFIVRDTIGGDDTVRGGSGNDLVFGGAGSDNIHGESGNDTIAAGPGNDTVIGGWLILQPLLPLTDGDDVISGGDGADTVYGDNFHPLLGPIVSLSGGDDQLFGDDGDDTLFGQTGHDELDGGPDDDALYGGVGNDDLSGGQGADDLVGDIGSDLMFGNEGPDTLDGGDHDDILVGGSGDDELFGRTGDDLLTGEAGNDLLVGGFGSDSLDGGADDDDLIGGNLGGAGVQADFSGDSLNGGDGHDMLLGDSGRANPFFIPELDVLGGDDTLQGGPGNDIIYGQAGVDFIGGWLGDDSIFGGVGNDIVSGDEGDDLVVGQGGDDLVAGGDGNDTVTGGSGDDILVGGVFSAGEIVAVETGDDLLDGDEGHDLLLGDSWALGDPLNFGVTGGHDTLRGGPGDDLVVGQSGNDSLLGDTGHDTLLGADGNDLIRGGEGNDQLGGGAGHDLLVGEEGDDNLAGGAGRDLLIAGLGADTLDGGDDDDILIAGTTTYDADDAALNQILAEWTSPRTYQARLKNIKGIGNGNSDFDNRLNGTVFLKKNGSAQTVFDDPVGNELTGSTGDDWFLFDVVLDELLDWTPGESKN